MTRNEGSDTNLHEQVASWKSDIQGHQPISLFLLTLNPKEIAISQLRVARQRYPGSPDSFLSNPERVESRLSVPYCQTGLRSRFHKRQTRQTAA